MPTLKLGELIDKQYLLREKRLEYQRAAEAKITEMKQAEQEVEDLIINNFDKQAIESARGSVATASLVQTDVPRPKDWLKFVQYVAKTKAWDLLERRITRTAWKSRVEAGEKIPGVEVFKKKDLSLTEINKE